MNTEAVFSFTRCHFVIVSSVYMLSVSWSESSTLFKTIPNYLFYQGIWSNVAIRVDLCGDEYYTELRNRSIFILLYTAILFAQHHFVVFFLRSTLCVFVKNQVFVGLRNYVWVFILFDFSIYHILIPISCCFYD